MRDRVGSNAGYAAAVFREARRDDLAGVMRLMAQLNRDDPELDRQSAASRFDAILATPFLTIFVLEEDGELVASTYLNVIPNLTRSGAPYAVIENVVVDEALRGTGRGKLVMAGTLEAAWAAGCYKAMLQTGSRRASTHAFYRACGFSPDEKTAYLARP